MVRQLTLGLSLQEDARFESFIPGDNQAMLHYLHDFLTGKNEPVLYLHGINGVGKTHLVQACCHELSLQHQRYFYLPLKQRTQFTPEILMGLESLEFLCMDDIDSIAGDAAWEEALFHCYNRMHDQGGRLLLTASKPVADLTIQLNDLRSRLAWGVVYQLKGLDEADRIRVLKNCAQQRGMALHDDVIQFLMKRESRSLDSLMNILEQLDQASLEQQRKITVPFVKAVLKL